MVRFSITFRFFFSLHLSLIALGTQRNDGEILFLSFLFVDVMGIFLRAILHFDLLLSLWKRKFFLCSMRRRLSLSLLNKQCFFSMFFGFAHLKV